MRGVVLLVLAIHTSILCALEVNNKEINNNDVSPSTGNLDSNLRQALLNALKELENEDSQPSQYNDKERDKTIERASASAVSLITRDNVVVASTTSSTVSESLSTTEKPTVLLQKSEGEHRLTISTFEKDTDSENFLTSASNNFALSKQQPEKYTQNQKSISPSLNLIDNENKFTTNKPIDTTTILTTTSTEESEAKVENVQFFSAPLVAAFTVHQDELGLPNKVESIFKPIVNTASSTTIKPKENLEINDGRFQEQSQLLQKHKALEEQILSLNLNLKQQQLALQHQQNFNTKPDDPKNNQNNEDVTNLRLQQQLALQHKQKNLEEEILRLNLSLKQQQQIALQQQLNIQKQNFLLQQEQLRFRANQIVPASQLHPSLSQSVFGTVQQLPTKEPQAFNGAAKTSQNGVSLQPSISFEPLSDAGKLPLNGQFLPIREAVNFHSSPIIQPVFQQFSPTSPPFPNLVQPSTFQQLPLISNSGQSNRFLRQESGVGNFINKGISKPSSTFSIQKSIQPPQITDSNSLRFNGGSTSFNQIEPFRAQFQQNQFFPSNSLGISSFSDSIPQTRNRFFRSNLESHFNAPTNYYNSRQNSDQVGNFLYNSGALRGKSQEDLGLISKVLSLNHLGHNNFRPLVRHFRRTV